MADGISDEKFKEEMLRLMKFAVIKIGENSKEIALLRKDFDRNTRELKNLKKEIRENSGAFADIRFRSSGMIIRLWEIQRQVNSIADLHPYLQEEYKRINAEILELIETIDENPDAEMQFDELDVRLENLEEKAFA
ncbi:MAG: hypothetical protein ACR2F2_00745 [Pyrinomonadaceae bacterium]